MEETIGHPLSRAYLSSLPVEGVKSTLGASCLQMLENTVNTAFLLLAFYLLCDSKGGGNL